VKSRLNTTFLSKLYNDAVTTADVSYCRLWNSGTIMNRQFIKLVGKWVNRRRPTKMCMLISSKLIWSIWTDAMVACFQEPSRYLPERTRSKLTTWSRILEMQIVTQIVEKFPLLSWNPKVRCHVYKSPPLVSILSQMNSNHHFPSYFLKIYSYSSSHLHLGLPTGLFPSGFPTKVLYAVLISPCVLHDPPISPSSI